MFKPEKEQLHGTIGTILFHIVVLAVLLLVVIERPQQQDEEGVPVVMGNILSASGDAYEYTEVAVAPPVSAVADPKTSSGKESLITQTDEPSVVLPDSDDKKKNEKPEKTKEQLEAERKALEAEQKRLETERVAREAESRIAGAFGKGAKMTNSGSAKQGAGNEGSVDGNAPTGVVTGVGGYGTFDLNGRKLGKGGLPRPSYNVQDEGRVVVTITVNPEGKVISADINSRTNTANPALRKAAIEAARKAVFNSIDGVNNQTGTITYYFKLR